MHCCASWAPQTGGTPVRRTNCPRLILRLLKEARRPREQLLFLMGLIAESRRMRSYLGLPRAVDLAEKIGLMRVGYVLRLKVELIVRGELKTAERVMGRFTPLATMLDALEWLVDCNRLVSRENICRSCLCKIQI